MKRLLRTIQFIGLILIAACAEEPPPVSVNEFIENPRLLEATMVRCAENRTEMKYEAECVNAREAVNRLEAAAERIRREDLEKQSERKRQALRRTQEAAAAARRRALEEQRRHEEEEYLGLFEQLPPESAQPPAAQDGAGGSTQMPSGNPPTADLDTPPETIEQQSALEEPPPEPGTTDLGAIREELKRRQETAEN